MIPKQFVSIENESPDLIKSVFSPMKPDFSNEYRVFYSCGQFQIFIHLSIWVLQKYWNGAIVKTQLIAAS